MVNMTVLTYPNPLLQKISLEVTRFDENLRRLVDDMLDTLYYDDGVGLAANQVGVLQRVIVIDVSEDANSPQILINPKILSQTGLEKSKEGCLSVPDLYGEVERAAEICVEAQDLSGQRFRLDNVTGLFSRCIQHEIDHLNGKLYFDLLSPLKKQIMLKKLRKMACQT
ncbi:MAG: peptide deformylase [Legionellales bacterium]|nr:peptide deformylase [Legionellales bacterium]